METFKVSFNWIEWAHGPRAESGYKLATELCDLPVNKRRQVEIPHGRRDLIEEVKSVAELYICEDDYKLQACRVVARCNAVLRELDEKYPLSSALHKAAKKAGI